VIADCANPSRDIARGFPSIYCIGKATMVKQGIINHEGTKDTKVEKTGSVGLGGHRTAATAIELFGFGMGRGLIAERAK
jgi:hypothetical protein